MKWLLLLLCSLANASEIDCLAKNIYYESRGEPEVGQFLVGFVTINRLKSKKFPNTICKVVKQRHQFSWYWDGKSDRPYNREAWTKSKEIAQIVYNSRELDVSQYGLYFKAVYAKSTFFNKLKKLYNIGKHEFYE